MKKYQIIYADPPWQFGSKELQKYKDVRFTSLEKHYITQKNDWIANLPVKEIIDDDCALFLWSTDAHLKEAITIIEAWGFKYITIAFVWEKISKKGNTVANLGAWTMKNYELCLFGTKGGMLKYKQKNNIQQKVVAVRNKHSQKPDIVRRKITELFGNLPRIELFAREKIEGWDAMGFDIDGKDIMESLNEMINRETKGNQNGKS